MNNLGLECLCNDTPAKVDRAEILRHAPCAMIALALIGLAVAVYDSYMIYSGLPLWCPPPIDGCNEVAASPHARILGLPVGYTASCSTFTWSAWRRCSPLIRFRVGCALA